MLVIGLPRSGTAWLAKFLGLHHEAIFHFGLEGTIRLLKRGEGTADCGAMFFMDAINREVRVPVLKVVRPAEDVKASLRAIALSTDIVPLASMVLDSVPADMTIRFPEFTDPTVARQIWHRFRESPFDERRHSRLGVIDNYKRIS